MMIAGYALDDCPHIAYESKDANGLSGPSWCLACVQAAVDKAADNGARAIQTMQDAIDKAPRFYVSSRTTIPEGEQRYLIPIERAADWVAFYERPADDPASQTVPEWAALIDGWLTFTDPRIG